MVNQVEWLKWRTKTDTTPSGKLGSLKDLCVTTAHGRLANGMNSVLLRAGGPYFAAFSGRVRTLFPRIRHLQTLLGHLVAAALHENFTHQATDPRYATTSSGMRSGDSAPTGRREGHFFYRPNEKDG
jgi:hypothetical protein